MISEDCAENTWAVFSRRYVHGLHEHVARRGTEVSAPMSRAAVCEGARVGTGVYMAACEG